MTQPAQPLPENQPQLQFAVRVGAIGPDSVNNVFSDYQKLIVFHARRASLEMRGELEAATGYFLFGSREGRSYMKPIDKEEAERLMVETFLSNMTVERVSIIDSEPVRSI